MEKKLDRIFLIGFMGVGKTTVGKSLSEKLNYSFIDIDDVIVDKFNIHNDNILGFFEDRKKYLDEETIILENLIKRNRPIALAMENVVVATGGGIVILPKNREILKNAGLVVYLSSSVDQLLMRTAKSKTRPLLENSSDRRKTITELVDARDTYYREVASLVADTTGKKLHEVINIIKRENENVE